MQGTRKPTKTAAELKAMVDQQAAGWPECHDMLGAAIIRPADGNWDVSLAGEGPTLVKASACWNRLGPFVRALQERYDLEPLGSR